MPIGVDTSTIVASQNIENQKFASIDLSALPAGGYVVRMGGLTRTLVKK